MTPAHTIEARGAEIAMAIELWDFPPEMQVFLVSDDVTLAAGALFAELHRLTSAALPTDESDPLADAESRSQKAAWLERNRAVKVFNAITLFIERAWCERRRNISARQYLVRWAMILDQLNDGTRHPLTEPKPPGRGMTVAPIEHWRIQAHACVAFYCFERDGRDMAGHVESRRKIALEIAKAVPGLSRVMRGTVRELKGRDRSGEKQIVEAVLSWRRSFRQGEAPFIAQETWQNGCALADEMTGGDPAEYARHAQSSLAIASRGLAALI
jgi:hypothetical protein